MKKYECEPCGYIYDPEVGDPDTVLQQEHHLKTFQRIGYVQSAVWEKRNLENYNSNRAKGSP